MSHALIVEDDREAAEVMAALIATEGFTVATANSLREARAQLSMNQPDLVLIDLMLPDGSGMDLLDDRAALSNSEVVFLTGHASLETSIQALRHGATDYLIKPVNIKQLQGILSRLMRPSELQAELSSMRDKVAEQGNFGLLWGRSTAMRQVYEQLAKVAGTSVTVFVTGESGSGKEVVAQTVHDLSRRRKQPFLAVNCGAISPHLIESEIFGHEKGSFTGAERMHQGFFERAHGGTLFLDEVTEMPPELQVKLLRVLETGLFMRVGSTQSREADVRIIAATNRDPLQAVAQGKLREDLLYRLNVFPVDVPPLRDRIEDVPLLAEHFLADICRKEGGAARSFNQAALQAMSRHHWPGNVRELRNVVQRSYVMANGPEVDVDAISLPQRTAPTSSGPAGGPALTLHVGQSMAEAERFLILATLRHFDNHKERTAATLGISLKTLYNRLKDYSEGTPIAD